MMVNTTHIKITDVMYVVVIQKLMVVIVQDVVVHLKNMKVVDGNVKHIVVEQVQPHQYRVLVKVTH
jgi:hypothetical protein